MKITVEAGRGRTLLLGNPDGVFYAANFTSDTHARQASKRLGIPADVVDRIVAKFRADGTTEHEYTPLVEVSEDTTPPDVFKVRRVDQPEAQATLYDSFVDALKHRKATGDHIITWKDDTEVAALDFDWHGEGSTPPDDITSFAHLANPQPTYAWATRSGGLRLVYLRQGDTPASSLAAVAAYALYQRLQPQGLELVTSTRFPTGDVVELAGGFDLSAVKAVFDERTYDPARRDDYLMEQGLTLGARYPHDHCPINPTHKSNSPEPVQVLEDGIKCYSCAARGRSFVSWYQLLGDQVPTQVAVCVRKFTHWTHARFIVAQNINLPDALLEPFYRAALIVCHGADDVRIASVFRERDLIRFDGHWGTVRGEFRRDDKCRFTVMGMPGVIGRDGKPDMEVLERWTDSANLDEWGYFPIRRVFGMAMSTRFLTPADGRPRLEICHGPKPRYLSTAERMSEDDAWKVIETAYPGVHRPLIEVLAFARGLVEYGTDNSPMFLLEGVSGSGKTGSPKLAAAICGESCTELVPQDRQERMFQQILNAVTMDGNFISVSEVMKAARRAKQSPRDFLDFLLQVTPGVTAHVMYKGPTRLGTVPVMCISDIEFTDEVLGDGQLGRRLHYYDLGTEYNPWRDRWLKAGLSGIWAVRSTPEFADASDSLLSIWIDRYWLEGPRDLHEVAVELGVHYLDERQETNDRTELMKQLFIEWRKYGGATGAYAKRQTKGFKAFKIDPDKYDIAKVWEQLRDEGSPTTWSRSGERSWQKATGHPLPLRIKIKPLYEDRENWVQITFQEQRGKTWHVVSE